MNRAVNSTESESLTTFAQVRQQVIALCGQRRYAAAHLYLVGSGFDAHQHPGLWEYVARRATADGSDPLAHKLRSILWSNGTRGGDIAIEEARHYLGADDPESAAFVLENVFGPTPQDRVARHLLGQAYLRRAQRRQDRTPLKTDVDAALRLAAAFDLGSVEEVMTIVDLLRFSGELAKARDVNAAARDRFPDEVRLLTRAARIEEQAGALELAIAIWEDVAAQSDRYRTEALFRLFELNTRMERPDEVEAKAVELLVSDLSLPDRMRLALMTERSGTVQALARYAASGSPENGRVSFEDGKALGTLLLDNGDIGLLAWLRRRRVPLGENVKSALASCGFGVHPDRPLPSSFAEAAALRSPDFMVPLEDFLELDPKPAGWPSIGKRPERLLLVNGSLGAGGAERQFVELVMALLQAGYAPEALHVAFFSIARDRGHAHFLPDLEALGVPIHDLANRRIANPTLPKQVQVATEVLPRGLRNDTRALWHLISEIQPGALHGWQDRSAAACGLAGLLASVERVVLSLRNMSPRTRRDQNLMLLQRLFSDYAKRENVVITTNAIAAADDYADWLGTSAQRIGCLSNAVDVARFNPEVARDRRKTITKNAPLRIGGLFRLALNKRPLLWLRIVAALRHSHGLDVAPIIRGTGPLEDETRRLAHDLGLDDLIIEGGATTPEDLYGDVDLLLLASRVEGVPNVLLEAQACGIPVAACNVGGVQDAMLRQGKAKGLLLDAETEPEAAAAQIAKWLPGALAAPVEPRIQFVEQNFGTRKLAQTAILAYEGRLVEGLHP